MDFPTKQPSSDDEKALTVWLWLLTPIIVTGKIQVAVRRNITYDDHVNHDIQQHSMMELVLL